MSNCKTIQKIYTKQNKTKQVIKIYIYIKQKHESKKKKFNYFK